MVVRDNVCPVDVKSVYAGHEVAVHTVSHPNLVDLCEKDIIMLTIKKRKQYDRPSNIFINITQMK